MDLKTITAAGEAAGKAAASWYDVDDRNAKRLLDAIDDIDPEVLDTFPACDIDDPGDDSMTPEGLWRLLQEAHPEVGPYDPDSLGAAKVTEEYRIAFNDAVEAEIARRARYHLQEG